MSGLEPDFASFAGVAGADPASLVADPRWEAAIARAASRVASPAQRFAGPRGIVACRGHAGSHHRDGEWIALLDGTVENLRELAAAGDVSTRDDPCDAAVVARLFVQQGEDLLPRLEGSFSLVVANLHTGDVVLARDRFGSRPLFYTPWGPGIAWASEIKSLLPLVEAPELDLEGLRQAVHYRFVIGETLLRNVSQVLPASLLRFTVGRPPLERRYWRLVFEPAQPGEGLDAWADRADAGLEAFMTRLGARQSRVGILLSGGVDSSLLALKAKQAGLRDCVAFTARWPGENPELAIASAIAKHIGIEHQIVDIDESRFERLLPWIVWRLEELPRHYNSLVLACLFEHAAARCGTVLHGHSADAMFGPPDAAAISTFKRRRRFLGVIPRPLRRLLAARLPYNGNRRIHRLRQYLELDEHGYLKSQFAIEYGRARAPVKDQYFRPRGFGERALAEFYEPGDPAVERMQRLDTYTFNQSHFAVLDRLGAPLGLPVRTPFLSREMIAIARTLPSELKVTGTLTKPVLKRLMARSFPHEWVYRSKQGFPTQTARWLAGPLARWRHMLGEERTRARGLLSLRRKRLADIDRHYEAVWGSICLEIFCRQFLDGDAGPDFPASQQSPP